MSKTLPMISVVIPTYNRKELVSSCIASVLSMRGKDFEVVVVDNSSSDGTLEAIQNYFPSVRVIRSRTNLGVAGGRNLGAKASRGRYILFLDNDTVVDEDLAAELYYALETEPSIALVGPVVYYYGDPRRIWSAGTTIDLTTGRVSFNRTGEIDHGNTFALVEVQVLPTAFMMERRLFEHTGMFDEIFFAHYEDADLCFRLRERGYKIACVPKARVWHKIPIHRAISEERVLSSGLYISRNRILFMRKHSKRFPTFLALFLPILTIYWVVHALCRGRLDWLFDILRGTVLGLSFAIKGETRQT